MVLIGQLIGGSIGLFIGWIIVYYIPDRRHRRECLRQFDAHVAGLQRQMEYWERMLEEEGL